MPIFKEGGQNGNSYAYFDDRDRHLFARGTTGSVSGSNFSDSTIVSPGFTAYIVCEREEPSSATQQDVFFLKDNDSNYGIIDFYFTSADSFFTGRMTYSGVGTGDTDYDTADDEEFHYHAYNSYENYNQLETYASIQADGVHHDQFGSAQGQPYAEIENDGSIDTTFTFTGTSNHFMGVGCKLSGSTITPTFKGKIYEILLFKREHGGPNVLDHAVYGDEFGHVWKDMYYYFHRKYQKITPKN